MYQILSPSGSLRCDFVGKIFQSESDSVYNQGDFRSDSMAKKQKFPHLLGSKWTAKQKTFGWRHFQVQNRKTEGKWVFAELVSSCDPTVRFWINARQLKDDRSWAAGWTPLNELHTFHDPDPDWIES
jgi:tryptophan-rich hypothetical protein